MRKGLMTYGLAAGLLVGLGLTDVQAMPLAADGDGALRCHFNLVCAHQTLVDQEGVEVADVDQARTLAIEVALNMIRTGEAQIADWRGWRLEVTNGSGAVLFTLNLDALLS